MPRSFRRYLTLAAAGGLAAALLVPLTGSTASASDPRQRAYEDAAQEFGVPADVLLAVSYLETRWNSHAGQPSRAAGFGPMHLTDLRAANANPAEPGEDARGKDTDRKSIEGGPALQTVDTAAALTHTDRAALRTDPTQNIRGGAALLAKFQRDIGAPVSQDPADWYGAVAKYSGAKDEGTARWFADEAYGILAKGAGRVTDDGSKVTLAPRAVTGDKNWLAKAGLEKTSTSATECPRTLACEWIPAPYQEYTLPDGSVDYGNHDKANRPESQKLRYIIIHDTEGSYAGTIKAVQDPTYVSWQYTMRNSDGHIAQHVKRKDVAWQAGNWYVNSKSIGIEHEGYAARGTWYSETMYRKSSQLVRYLAAVNNIPLDRQHILGHDNVQGITPIRIPDMHWDPGPYWDWTHYFELLGAPFRTTGTRWTGMVTIKPDFKSNNPGFFGCENNPGPPGEGPRPQCGDWGSSALILHTEPSEDAPLLKDWGTHPSNGVSTKRVSDIGSRISTGQQFAVAEVKGDWTAIWFLGQKGWFHNPRGARTALWATGLVVTPKQGKDSVIVYGRAYPEPEAYPVDIPATPLAPLPYRVNKGERYVFGQAPETENYIATTFDVNEGHVVVRGKLKYYQIQYGHRVGYVLADDVDLLPSWKKD